MKKRKMEACGLGKVFKNGEIIIRQGDRGDCMFIIEEGQVEVFQERNGEHIKIADLYSGDIFGEMAAFDHNVRFASVKAVGDVRLLTVDKKTLFKRIYEDPSLAFRIMEKMANFIVQIDKELIRIKTDSST
jgi:CRP/FNR family cyclic AMP-dependent transcriptional regulator